MLELGNTAAEPWMVFNATRKLAIALAQRGRLDEALRCFDTQTDWIRDHQREWNVDVWFCDCAFVMELANQRDAAIASYEQTLAMARAHQIGTSRTRRKGICLTRIGGAATCPRR